MAENTTNETRFVGNVTKSTTGATLFAGSILTIVNYGLAQAGITIPAEVQTAAVTVILGLVVLITGRNTRGEKAHLEGAIQGETAAALANLDLYEVLEAIADGVAADARNAAPHEADGRAAFEEYRNTGAVQPTQPAQPDTATENVAYDMTGGRQYRYGEAGAPEGGAPGQIYDPRVGWVDEIADQFPSDSVAR